MSLTWDALATIPQAVVATNEFLAKFDQCFLSGFSRMGEEQKKVLQSLQNVFMGTPLANMVKESVAALLGGEMLERHFVSLAAARTALQGAQYDALLEQAFSVLNRKEPTAAEPPLEFPQIPPNIATWLESTRQWLTEIALCGFMQLESSTLSPFAATLEQLQGQRDLVRQAALVTGFINELLTSLPISSLPQVPVQRWVDLWTRSMVLSVKPFPTPKAKKVKGIIKFFGADIRQHANFVSVIAYGVLEQEKTPQLVRASISSFKVAEVTGDELWHLWPVNFKNFFAGLEKRLIHVEDMTLYETGDLLWDGKTKMGKAFDPMKEAAHHLSCEQNSSLVSAHLNALDRHPVQIVEPIFLENYTVLEKEEEIFIDLGAIKIPVATERMSQLAEIDAAMVTKSKQLMGLLCFDGGTWRIHVLSALITKGKKTEHVYTGHGTLNIVSKKLKKGCALDILQERASRLLRA